MNPVRKIRPRLQRHPTRVRDARTHLDTRSTLLDTFGHACPELREASVSRAGLQVRRSLKKAMEWRRGPRATARLRREGRARGRATQRAARTLEELRNFKAAGDPFTKEFFRIFQAVYRNHVTMLEKLQLRKSKLDKKLRYLHAWRKVSSMIFAATFAVILICSVVAAAVAQPHVAGALAAAASIPVCSVGKWIDSLLKNYENAVKGQKETIVAMQVGTGLVISDLENIRVLVDRLEIEIQSMLQNAELAVEEGEVKIGVEEIKKKLSAFMKNIDQLGVQADNCSRDIRRARTVVLQRIIKSPNQ